MVDGLHCKAVNPINCLPRHSNESIANADHVAAGYVNGGDAQDYCFKTSVSCHDSGGASGATVSATHDGDCALCQTPCQT